MDSTVFPDYAPLPAPFIPYLHAWRVCVLMALALTASAPVRVQAGGGGGSETRPTRAGGGAV